MAGSKTTNGSGGLPVLSWFDGPVKQSINAVFEEINAGVESLDLFSRFHRAHIEALRLDVQNIKLLGMSSPAKLIDIYNPARVSTTIKRRLYSEEWLKVDQSNAAAMPKPPTSTQPNELIQGDEFVEKQQRVTVLGGPGAGKTTFLRFLALAYLDKSVFEKTNLKRSKFPFFVPLPLYYKGGLSLFDFLLRPIREKTNAHAKSFLQRILMKGQVILLLDSLDEVPKTERPQLLAKVKSFCATFPNVNVVLSCRTADYTVVLDLFHEVEISKLDRPSVHKIVKAWFSTERKKAADLCSIIDNDKSIASLTETPLLLSLLCIQFRHDLSLPKRKVELFKRCSETLLRDWDTTRGFRRTSSYESLTDQAKEKLFEVIAGHFTVKNFTFLFPNAKVLELVSDFCTKVGLTPQDAPQILQEVDQHHGILEQFSQDHYGFSHTSFQEYFAARSIIAQGTGLGVVQRYYDDEDMHPVIEFVVAMADDPSEMIEFLISKSSLKGLTNYPPMAKRTGWLHLLYRCIATGPYISLMIRKKAIDHLIESQIEIARIYGGGGVIPMSQLMEDGIRHPFFWTSKRPSLSIALQPFRKLSNEILKSPILGYADAVFKALPNLRTLLPNSNPILYDALLLNLVTPLATTHGPLVYQKLSKLIEGKPNAAITQFVEVTLKSIAANYREV